MLSRQDTAGRSRARSPSGALLLSVCRPLWLHPIFIDWNLFPQLLLLRISMAWLLGFNSANWRVFLFPFVPRRRIVRRSPPPPRPPVVCLLVTQSKYIPGWWKRERYRGWWTFGPLLWGGMREMIKACPADVWETDLAGHFSGDFFGIDILCMHGDSGRNTPYSVRTIVEQNVADMCDTPKFPDRKMSSWLRRPAAHTPSEEHVAAARSRMHNWKNDEIPV